MRNQTDGEPVTRSGAAAADVASGAMRPGLPAPIRPFDAGAAYCAGMDGNAAAPDMRPHTQTAAG